MRTRGAVLFGRIIGVFMLVGSMAARVFGENISPALIPIPEKVVLKRGEFKLLPRTRLVVQKQHEGTGKYLQQRLNQATGYRVQLEIQDRPKARRGTILVAESDGKRPLRPEGYMLEVTSGSVTIRGDDVAGAFYGAVTFLQLLPPQISSSCAIPCLTVEDGPRFAYRGYLLDVARHFFTKAELKEVIDSLALHKLNRLQLHLTDDQGWRLEIKKYPRLTEMSAWRKNIGFGLDPKSSKTYGPDGRYGGFYSQEDIRELVAYANSRHVMLVPEIEMPGHASGALSAYPELSCSGGPYNTDSGGGVFDGVFCAGNPKTYEFIEAVLTEVAALFSGTYIHIGGDEVPKRNWKGCAKCQAQMRAENLKTEESLQSYFIGRAERVVKRLGRTLIGWSEIQEGGLVKDAVLMDWIGGGLESARQGHKVIMSPTSFCYLDYYQATNRPGEPRAIGGYVPLDRTYRLEPIPEGLEPEHQLHVLGAQGNLWTEYIASLQHAQYMTFPRLCALAEVTWSPKRARNYDDFTRRLETHLQRLDALKINYRRGIPGRDEPRETKARN